jgi:hypothetical protein
MLTDNLAQQWCPKCETRDKTPTLCAQCKLPHYAIVPTMFGEGERDASDSRSIGS